MIRTKGIWVERIEDAPFFGALISSIDCHNNCPNCFNQHVKELPTIEYSTDEIISKVKENPFHQGIILAGLEWTEQPEEMRELIDAALRNNLQVMLYTGMEENEFKEKFSDVYHLPIFIKFGRYDESQHTETYEMYGVKLRSMNQYIRKG